MGTTKTTERKQWRWLALFACIAGLVGACAPQSGGPSGSAEEHVRHAATGPVDIQHDGPTGMIVATVPLSVSASATTVEKANAYLAEYGAALGVDPASLHQVGEVAPDATMAGDGAVVVYQQQVDGVPVVGSDVRVEVSTTDATADAATSHTVSTDGVSTTPSITADQARAAVAALAGLTPAGTPTLALLDVGFAGGLPASGVRLVWAVQANGADQPIVYVDAQTGAVISRAARLEEARQREIYDAQRMNTIETLPGTSVLVMNEAGAVAGQAPDADATALYAVAGRVYDYYHDTFHRDGHDDRGTLVRYYTHFPFPGAVNAAWLTGMDSIVFDDGTVTDDIAAHELTHGVVEKTSGFIYEGWSGALNESTADVFAMMIVRSGWTIGAGSTWGELRDLADPTVHGQPRNMSAAMLFPAGTVATDANDELGVHHNSGIFNYVAYLITEGGTSPDSGIAVQGVGYEKAEQIYYRALTRWSGPAMRPADHRIALRLAALQFAKAGTFGITAADCGSVIDGLAAVGIGDADTDGDCWADGVDNCPSVPNFDQADANHDGHGDACVGDAGPMCRTHIQRCTMDSDCCGAMPMGTNICELGQCVDGAMCMRVGSVCTSGSDCCEGVRCAATGTLDTTTLHCCARGGDPCRSQDDCCGTTECSGGRCQCRTVGQTCVTGGDCCGSAFCSAGICATS